MPWVTLMIAFYYQIHKYPLGFDSIAPANFVWKVSKYVLVSCLAVAGFLARPRILFLSSFFEIVWWLTFGAAIVFGCVAQSVDLIECGFWGVAALSIARLSSPIYVHYLKKWNIIALILNLLMISIQMLGHVYFGKLFAGSNENFWLSRFSGLTVEPFSAAFLGFYYLGFAFAFKDWKSIAVLVLGSFCVIVSQTWTAYIYLAILIVLLSVLKMRRHAKCVLLSWALLATLCIMFFWYCKIDFVGLYELKMPSVRLHMNYWWPDRWHILPTTIYNFNETWWVNGVENMGVIWTVAYHVTVIYLLLVIWRKFQNYRNTDCGWIYLTTLIMGGYFLFGSLNLPYPVIYPANFIFFLFAFLCYFDRFKSSDADS